tara:strand:+ start:1328 stop:1888 length:561 start_codon:yes stop_codon:yes gene_type:complete
MDFDFDYDVHSSDDEREERNEMAYEDALIKYKDSPEKLHKAKTRYKRPWTCKKYLVECPERTRKAIYALSLPEDILKMVYRYIFPYKVNHVTFKNSLFRYRMERDNKLDKTVERYIRSLVIHRGEFSIPGINDSDPYYEFEDHLEKTMIQKLKYIKNTKPFKDTICGPLRRFDKWYDDNTSCILGY